MLVGARIEEVWGWITDVAGYGLWSPECVYGAWVDGADGPAVGAWFEARNEFADGFKTEVRCRVTLAEEPVRFGWDVFGGEDEPFAHWEYELAARADRTLIRQSFTHGPGDSGMRRGVLADPAGAEAAKQRRLDQLGRNMRLTIAAMVNARA
ncbi:polyketide cyclase/dehydrase/lipid transport protein [Kribbella voronezhensis]|uniref:Polyketide cyclase/dehydrase/lipid transport protein n=1 Tax=Kribbella voronezhensis TaxID=2512212 RepID=A0A4R7TDQ4_9ACTN|nr:polyketide cyclase/dehydrase/lipid transport protein [Kribbella voronezhensis]